MHYTRAFYDEQLLDIERLIGDHMKGYFVFFCDHIDPSNYAGWKYTIVGKNEDDAVYLAEKLGTYLLNINVGFKIGTTRLVYCGDDEQQHKLMTIYVNRDTNVELLENDLKHFLKDYKGGEGVKLKFSEQINEYLYKRADIDEEGNYIAANPEHQNQY